VVIIADSTASARFVASDLLAQAEHAEDAAALLITDSESLAAEVLVELAMQSKTLPRIHVVEKSLAQLGAIIIVTDLVEACEIANELVPEHLEIMVHEEELVASRIENAGAIFLGEQTPEAVGDYIAGPNHVLPTCRTARFSSALSVHDFVKRTSVLKFSRAELSRTAPMIATLARAEGFEAHARSALIRGEADQ
jgi:histidinol dehydrogenase